MVNYKVEKQEKISFSDRGKIRHKSIREFYRDNPRKAIFPLIITIIASVAGFLIEGTLGFLIGLLLGLISFLTTPKITKIIKISEKETDF